MVLTDLIHKVVGRSDDTWTSRDKKSLYVSYGGDDSKTDSVRSILQQSGVKLSDVKHLQKYDIVTDVVLDDYSVGLKCDLDLVWCLSTYSRKYLLSQ
jgi:hypothetical protein